MRAPGGDESGAVLESVRVETIYSLSGDVPAARCGPRRGDDDVALWPGALTSGSVRRVCSIRKLSAGGAILHVDHEVEVGERLELELMNGEQLDGSVVWRRGSRGRPVASTARSTSSRSSPRISSASPASAAACRASS